MSTLLDLSRLDIMLVAFVVGLKKCILDLLSPYNLEEKKDWKNLENEGWEVRNMFVWWQAIVQCEKVYVNWQRFFIVQKYEFTCQQECTMW